MHQTFPILAAKEDDLCNEMLIDVYRSELERDLKEHSSPLAVWFSLIQILNFFNYIEEEKEERERLESYVKKLPPSSLAIFGNFNEFFKRELDVSVTELMDRRKNNIEKGGWDSLSKK